MTTARRLHYRYEEHLAALEVNAGSAELTLQADDVHEHDRIEQILRSSTWSRSLPSGSSAGTS